MKQSPARTLLQMTITRAPGRPQLALSAEELAAATGISATRLGRLERLGLVEPLAPGSARSRRPPPSACGGCSACTPTSA
jgi:hypothetical protein